MNTVESGDFNHEVKNKGSHTHSKIDKNYVLVILLPFFGS